MKHLMTLICIATLVFVGNAQKLVTVSHNGQASFFTGNSPVNDAVAAAVSGDTIYIPGGGFSVGTLTIDKSLTIYGVGHSPDSTNATYRTEITGNITLVQGASNTKLEGFYLSGDLTFGTSAGNQFVENITIKRINLQTLRLSWNGSAPTTANNILVEENIIRSEIQVGYATGVVISKNRIAQGFRYASNTLITNNILFGSYCGSGPFYALDNCLIQNNFIYVAFSPCTGNYFIHSGSNTNHFANNAININQTFPAGTNTGTGNWVNVSYTSFFTYCTGTGFDYAYDYHLQTPGSYLGTDGTEIGIYGTASPSKTGWVPENPHVSTKTISPQTDSNGELNINITVGAQDN